MTRREQQALSIIKDYISEHSISPTVREVQGLLGHGSSSSTHHILRNLQEKGYIKSQPRKPRTIQVLF